MQGQPFQNDIRIPYSKWAQHRADNGLIYLAHPVTGEVKWLWSRHSDPKTANDYLVNTVTGERQWVTKQNEHLCPVKPRGAQPSSAGAGKASPGSTNPFSGNARTQTKTQEPAARTQSKPGNSPYREIAAPKSLGLTADEVLMLVPETGRRYVYNKKTKSSRWLPDRPPDTIPSEGGGKGIFFRGRNSRPTPSPFDEESAASAELRNKLAIPGPNDMPRPAAAPPGQGTTPSVSSLSDSSTSTATTQPAAGKGASQTTSRPQTGWAEAQRARAQAPLNGQMRNLPTYSSDEAARIIQKALRGGTVRNSNVLGRLRGLTDVLRNIHDITSAGKYDMKRLRAIAEKDTPAGQKEEGAQRLLELGEYLTQQMLKVDGVESAGNQMVRAKRKESVKTILSLTDEVDSLRKKLQVKRG